MRPRNLDVRHWVGTSELLTTNPKTFEDEMKTNKQSGRKGGVAPSSKAKKQKTTKVKQVLSDDEFVGSLGDFFHGLPAFTFVADFPGREGTYESLGPTLTSVFDLLIRVRQGSTYRGPYMDICAR